jgi:quercetin dioxygenase-like cupin family protein
MRLFGRRLIAEPRRAAARAAPGPARRTEPFPWGGETMRAHTPGLRAEAALEPLASRYVDPDALPWQPTRFPGVEWKILMEDEQGHLRTALMRWAPGSELPLHEHVEIEQTYVLEGRLVDEQGECGPGQFVWRPKGSRHVARAPEGALMLAFFLKPNTFFDPDAWKACEQ